MDHDIVASQRSIHIKIQNVTACTKPIQSSQSRNQETRFRLFVLSYCSLDLINWSIWWKWVTQAHERLQTHHRSAYFDVANYLLQCCNVSTMGGTASRLRYYFQTSHCNSINSSRQCPGQGARTVLIKLRYWWSALYTDRRAYVRV